MQIRKYTDRSLILLALVIGLLLGSCSEGQYEVGPTIKYKLGDNPEWSKVDFDDSDWSPYIDKSENDIFWVRTDMNFKNDWAHSKKLGIFLAVFGAYEAYWDGVLLGTNGEIGNEKNKSGEYHRFFLIPDSLSRKGPHTLSLRASQKHYLNQQTLQDFSIYNYFDLVRRPLRITLYINILAGAFLITAIYFLILYFNDRKSFPVLLFSISSFLFFLLITAEYIKFYVPFHYSNFYFRLEAISILTLLISFLIPLYFSVQFSLIWRKYLVPIYLTILLAIFYFNHDYGNYDEMTIYLTTSMWVSSVIIVGYGVIKRIKGAVVVFIGLLINVFTHYLMVNYDYSLVLSFIILLLCMFYILGIRIREQRKAYEYSLVQTTRLRHELLKKKIQPHFLMNTLTSLIDWVEESPKKGVQFIEALAGEFDLLNQIEDKQLIPIEQEIQLCKSHLNIMKYRKEIEYVWENENIEPTETIPPALIHTLLENGITHCLPQENGIIKFKLIYSTKPNSKIYRFLTSAKIRNSSMDIREGTGTKYVKARLSESYGSKWDFSSEAIDGGWEDLITIYTK
ncbi:histidine kinase [Maribacter litoralis]|uniref:histidine kinase n=1 Tax=Maribacter litoralis TaxID=2059726 RepID=UPI003F5CF823